MAPGACSWCRIKGVGCRGCILSDHFPISEIEELKQVLKLFRGTKVKNMVKASQNPKLVVESLYWNAAAWVKDPVSGPYGMWKSQEQELIELRQYIESMQMNDRGKGVVRFYDDAVEGFGRVVDGGWNLNQGFWDQWGSGGGSTSHVQERPMPTGYDYHWMGNKLQGTGHGGYDDAVEGFGRVVDGGWNPNPWSWNQQGPGDGSTSHVQERPMPTSYDWMGNGYQGTGHGGNDVVRNYGDRPVLLYDFMSKKGEEFGNASTSNQQVARRNDENLGGLLCGLNGQVRNSQDGQMSEPQIAGNYEQVRNVQDGQMNEMRRGGIEQLRDSQQGSGRSGPSSWWH